MSELFDPNNVQRVSFKADDGEDMELVDEEDYSRLLEVMWLCRFHHAERHLELKAIGVNP